MAPLFLGIIILALGVAGLIFVNRRAFYRRNMAGVEEFNGFGSMVATRVFEKTVRIASWLVVVVGIALIAFPLMHR